MSRHTCLIAICILSFALTACAPQAEGVAPTAATAAPTEAASAAPTMAAVDVLPTEPTAAPVTPTPTPEPTSGYLFSGGTLTVLSEDGFNVNPNLVNINDVRAVVIADGITSVPYAAFCGWWELLRVEIPPSVREIEARAFEECVSLSLTIPATVTRIGKHATAYVGSVSVEPDSPVWTEKDGVVYTRDMRTLVASRRDIRAVHAPDTVTEIADYALAQRFELESVVAPGVTVIGALAFDGDISLTSLSVSDELHTVGQEAFQCVAVPEMTFLNPLSFRWAREDGDDDIDWGYAPLCAARVKRVILGSSGPDILLLLDVAFSLQQVVFLSQAPAFDCSEQAYRADTYAYAVYYLNEHAASWAPNGETEWYGHPLIGIDSLDELPQ